MYAFEQNHESLPVYRCRRAKGCAGVARRGLGGYSGAQGCRRLRMVTKGYQPRMACALRSSLQCTFVTSSPIEWSNKTSASFDVNIGPFVIEVTEDASETHAYIRHRNRKHNSAVWYCCDTGLRSVQESFIDVLLINPIKGCMW